MLSMHLYEVRPRKDPSRLISDALLFDGCGIASHNRAKPFLPDELCKLHEIKRSVHGRITK
jgi:hypothetical protein